jgi:hypothetical protein
MSQGITYILMLIAKVMIFIVIINNLSFLKKTAMRAINFFRIIPLYAERIYRLFKVKHRSEIVWKELIKLHKKQNWHFGQYDNEKYLLTSFADDNNNILKFYYEITADRLVFRVIILAEFNEECTNDIMLLSSHFNSLLNTGIVRVDIKNNLVEFVYSGDLLRYMLYPGEIHSDLDRHFQIAIDCYWAFTHLLNSGEEPVFIIDELIKRNNERDARES